LLRIQGKPIKQRKDRKKDTPVRRPSTPTLPARPKTVNQQGRDHQEENNSLYSSRARATTAILADRARGPEKVFTLGHRGYAIINQGGFDGSFGNQSERQTL
ncbi:hypothetical protein BBK36DRAFT_1180326, partial [Trichoderma citrinoviride]